MSQNGDNKPRRNPLITALLEEKDLWKRRARKQREENKTLKAQLAKLTEKEPKEEETPPVEEIGDKKGGIEAF